MRFGSSPGAFLNIFGAPGNVSQALLAGPGRPQSALRAPWARFWRPKHRTKSRPRVIVAALIVRERFGDDFRTIFDDAQTIFKRFGEAAGEGARVLGGRSEVASLSLRDPPLPKLLAKAKSDLLVN